MPVTTPSKVSTVVLGISALFHDAAAALVVDGVVVAAAEEERFSRAKHDAGLPLEATAFCLEQAGLTIEDVDHVVFYEKPLRKFERLLTTTLRTFPRGRRQFVAAMGTWLGGRLWLRGQLAEALKCEPERLLFCEHHLSHAASAFLPSPFESAAILTVDGVGEWATAGIYHGVTDADGTRIELLREQRFPHSIGLLYSAITAYLGFRVNNGEYKVMGLAAFGTPRFRSAFERFVDVDPDGAVTLDTRYFCFDREPDRSFTPFLEALLGPARQPESPLDPSDGGEGARFADIAATMQQICEEWLLAAAAEAKRLTGEDAVCLAGGVALNSVANARLAADGPFRQVFVQPAAGDAGGAVGAALHASFCALDVPRQPTTAACDHGAFLGKGWDAGEVERFLTECRIRHVSFETDDEVADHIAERLAGGEVGGLHSGRFEWGPRALGNRSILADPRRADTATRVNASIKFREAFRPFAPAVLSDEVDRWFERPRDDDGQATSDLLTPYMLAVLPVREEARDTLAAVTHVDGTARVQTVDDDTSPGLARVLRAFRERTGAGVLLNTSLNLKGEPMAASPEDAYAVFDRSGLDFLVMERCVVSRTRAAGGATR